MFYSQDLGYVVANLSHACRVLELTCGKLKPEVKQLSPKILHGCLELNI